MRNHDKCDRCGEVVQVDGRGCRLETPSQNEAMEEVAAEEQGMQEDHRNQQEAAAEIPLDIDDLGVGAKGKRRIFPCCFILVTSYGTQ